MPEHVSRLRREIAQRTTTVGAAVDDLCDRWDLTATGAIDLLERGEDAFRPSSSGWGPIEAAHLDLGEPEPFGYPAPIDEGAR